MKAGMSMLYDLISDLLLILSENPYRAEHANVSNFSAYYQTNLICFKVVNFLVDI